MNKGRIAILLLFSLIAPIGGCILMLHFQKEHLRKELSEKLHRGIVQGEIIMLEFSLEQTRTALRWEHDREFEFNGQMYDVIEKTVKGDTILFKCWWDREETALNRELDKWLSMALNNDPLRTDQQDNLVDFFKKLRCENYQSPGIMPIGPKLPWLGYGQNLKSISFPPPFPPPRMGWFLHF